MFGKVGRGLRNKPRPQLRKVAVPASTRGATMQKKVPEETFERHLVATLETADDPNADLRLITQPGFPVIVAKATEACTRATSGPIDRGGNI